MNSRCGQIKYYDNEQQQQLWPCSTVRWSLIMSVLNVDHVHLLKFRSFALVVKRLKLFFCYDQTHTHILTSIQRISIRFHAFPFTESNNLTAQNIFKPLIADDSMQEISVLRKRVLSLFVAGAVLNVKLWPYLVVHWKGKKWIYEEICEKRVKIIVDMRNWADVRPYKIVYGA